jgi:hypothetical protein
MLHSINAEQRLYVLSEGDGYSCLGFDNAFGHADQIAAITRNPTVTATRELIGTPEGYEEYRVAVRAWCQYARGRRIPYFEPRTPSDVRRILAGFIDNGRSARLFYGDPVNGRDWCEEHDCMGRICLSTGPMQIPILVGARQHGGPAILTSCVVRIQDAATRRELYRHPFYQAPVYQRRDSSDATYPVRLFRDGENVANFRTATRAERFIAFMLGTRMRAY